MTDCQVVDIFYPQIIEFFSTEQEKSLVRQACKLAHKAHKGQKRSLDNSPFISHPCEVAFLLTKKFNDLSLTLAAILHDTVEDCNEICISDIYNQFGGEVGFLVDAVTKTIDHFYKEPENKIFKKNGDYLNKVLYGGMRDVRCLLLKIGDRVHNVSTLEGLNPKKQIKKSFESQAIMVPLMNMLQFKRDGILVQECQEILDDYIKEKSIETALQFKENLFGRTFVNFNNNDYQTVYKNSANFVWKMKNRTRYTELIKTKEIEEKIEIISITIDQNDNFEAIFKWKKGHVLENKVSFEIGDEYYFI